MRIAFTKMHGVGNDFVVFDAPPAALLEPASLTRLADRRTGIGFDQALALEAPRRAGTAVFYRVFNASHGLTPGEFRARENAGPLAAAPPSNGEAASHLTGK